LLIADRLRDKTSIRSIARELGRPACTIGRERHRNQQPDGTYQPHAAQAMAHARRTRPKTGTLAADPALRAIDRMGWTSGTAHSRSPSGCGASIPTGRSGT
jgi:IS30 family transposase